ncbi:MAG: hypothetical protein WCT54_00350 [Patescibacteria group bacterium]
MKNFEKFVVLAVMAAAFLACGEINSPEWIDRNPPASVPQTDAAVQDGETDVGVDVVVDAQADAPADAKPDAPAYVPKITAAFDNTRLGESAVYYQDEYSEALWVLLFGDKKLAQKVKTYCVTDLGSGPATEVESVTLRDKDFMRISMDDLPLDDATGSVCFNGIAINVPVNGMVPVLAMVKYKAAQPGGEHQFAINAASDIVLDGNGTVEGDFPIVGETAELVDWRRPEIIYYTDESESDEVTINVGSQAVGLYDFYALPVRYSLTFNPVPIFVTSHDEGMIRGTDGTFYASHFQLADADTDELFGNPIDLDPNDVDPGAHGVYVSLEAAGLILEPGIFRHLRVIFDLASQEDAAGEFIGRSYRVEHKLPGGDGQVINTTLATPILASQVWPQYDLVGSSRRILAP